MCVGLLFLAFFGHFFKKKGSSTPKKAHLVGATSGDFDDYVL